MPDLKTLLASYDLAFLRDIAELWGIELQAVERRTVLVELAIAMTSRQLFDEVYASLHPSAATALTDLKAVGGKMAWQAFEHAHGELRPMGPARRKREKPHRFPQNTAEKLWYLGLVGRAALRENQELSEFAFIPDEFLDWLPEPDEAKADDTNLRQLPAWSGAKVTPLPPQGDRVLDDICTLFAALRMELLEQLPRLSTKEAGYWQLLLTLAKSFNLLDETGQPNENARVFLEKPRGEALRWLAQSWAQSLDFDELRLVPQLRCEGNWQHSAITPRRTILDRLGALPTDTWFKTRDQVDDIHQHQPDFLRSGTDYNTWIISSTDPETRLLHGFEHWQDVEGQYIRFLITELLVDLGMLQIGQLTDQPESHVFQITPRFSKLRNPEEKLELPEENQPVLVGRDGKLEMTPLVPRIARYQLSRFAEWRMLRPDRFVYHLTPASLEVAAEQGLELKHLRALLRKYGKPGIPPALQKALTRWESHGLEARIEPLLVLRLAEPELLERLRESKASGCLGEALGPTAVLVKPGCASRVKAALWELGILTDLSGDGE
jgi:hypothetical protein